jgi:ATP-dependent DNA ligase
MIRRSTRHHKSPRSQFEFVEWTADAHLRHSKFVALREDKKARAVRRE